MAPVYNPHKHLLFHKLNVFKWETQKVQTVQNRITYQMLPGYFAYAHHADGIRWKVVVCLAVFWFMIHKVTWAGRWTFTCLSCH